VLIPLAVIMSGEIPKHSDRHHDFISKLTLSMSRKRRLRQTHHYLLGSRPSLSSWYAFRKQVT
jgi:hypothetical protein